MTERPSGAVLRLPAAAAAQVSDVLQGRKAPVAARDAASVLLLRPAAGHPPDRAPGQAGVVPGQAGVVPGQAGGAPVGQADGGSPPGPSGLQVYLLRRVRSMAFAPGASVFPGGSVDPRDAEEQIAWAGPDAASWGRGLDAPPGLARALVCAAVRETFEETGVLLAGPTDATLVGDTSGPDWETDRQALLDRSVSLAGLLGRRGLVLRSDLLRPWARWITPEVEPRRFDTRFFAAALPPGQRTRHVGGEADEVAWWPPEAAIGAARDGALVLFPPTAVCLAQLARCRGVPGALRAVCDLNPVVPQVVADGGEFWLTLPPGLEYPL